MLRRHQKRRHLLGYRLLHPPHPLAAGLCQRNGNKTFLADVAAENLGSCAVMRVLGFTPTENGTFHRGSTTLEYRNLTFRKEL